MIAAVLDHLWQSTLFALAAALLALAFRRASAPVCYGLWFAASAKFLVPFAALIAVGRLVAPVGPPPAAVAAETVLIAQAAQPFSEVAPIHASAPGPDPALILLAIWALGSVVVLAVWTARWAKVRAAVRSATPLALAAPMPVLASSSLMEPGLVGLLRPVLVVPARLFEHLSRPEIDALLTHESCHLSRRDNLTAAVHMLVEALFWFHPLVWWIGARLIDERERACDEAVVRAGHDRTAYARSLVESCRLYLRSRLPCVAGASGSNLERRVAAILTSPLSSPLTAPRKSLLLAAGLTALATPVAAGWLTSPAERAALTRVSAAVSQAIPSRAGAPAPPSASAASEPGAGGEAPRDRPARPALSKDELVLDPGPASRPALDRPDDQEVTMKPFALASAVTLLASASPAAAHAPAATQTSAPSEAQAADPDQVVCRAPQSATMIETRVERRTCLPRAVWKELERRQSDNDRWKWANGPDPNGSIAGPNYVPPPPAFQMPTFTGPPAASPVNIPGSAYSR